jgi:choice-of-anchor B domain-containing protein
MCGCNAPENSPPAGGPDSFGSSSNVQLLSNLTLAQLGVTGSGVLANDCWGWQARRREFAIMGLTNATVFVEVTIPQSPVFLGTLPGAGGNEAWRDIKVYRNRAYIVADGSSNSSHGVQVFDLARLLNVANAPVTFTENARYTGLGRAHNIAINEATGFAYVIGSPSLSSSGGPIMLDLKQGVMPVFAGVFAADGYTHDCQVVTYTGPDTQAPGGGSYQGREIAFCCNEDTLTIVDVTNKQAPVQVARKPYQESRYSHQGWLTPDQKYFLMDDELDESQLGPFPTRTHVWDVQNLDNPVYVGFHSGTETTIDHNQYIRDNFAFQANYTSGLRILQLKDPPNLTIQEAGYFDTYGANNALSYNGAWSCYPYFRSRNILVSDRQNGLFVVKFLGW